MFQIANATSGTISIQFFIIDILRTQYQIELSGSSALIFLHSFFTNIRAGNTVFVDYIRQRHTVYTLYVRID